MMTQKFGDVHIKYERMHVYNDNYATRPTKVVWDDEEYGLWRHDSRWHFKCGDYLFKVSGTTDNKMTGGQNARELELWLGMEDCDRKYFAPILAFGGRTKHYNVEWLVMPFFRSVDLRWGPDTDTEAGINNRAWDKLQYLIAKYDIDDLRSHAGDNWLICKNYLPKIVDYGWGGEGKVK